MKKKKEENNNNNDKIFRTLKYVNSFEDLQTRTSAYIFLLDFLSHGKRNCFT